MTITSVPRPLTDDEIADLLRRPHASKIRIYFDSPPVIFACQVNQSFDSLDQVVSVSYDTVSIGEYTDVVPGMTCFLGSAPGLNDLGEVRIRDVLTDSIVPVGENADVFWDDDIHLTVIDDMFFWAKHPRTFVSGEVRMDWSIEYSSQHSACAPVPILGSDMIILWKGSPIDAHWSCSNSWCPSSGEKSVLWECDGVSIDNETSETPVFTISSPGRYRVSCTITVGTSSWTGYRYLIVAPLSEFFPFPFKISDCSGDQGKGGWAFSMTCSGSGIDIPSYRDRSRVFLIAEDWYGSSHRSIGPQLDRETVVVQGWLSGVEPISGDSVEGGEIEFEVLGPQYWIGEVEAFTEGLTSTPETPSSWVEISGLTLDKALWHLITWRSTISSIIDVYPSGSTTTMKELQSDAGNLWVQIQQNAESIVARPCCDRFGRLFCEVEPQLIPVENRSTIPEIYGISRSTCSRPISLERSKESKVSQVSLSGVRHVDGNSPVPIFSLSGGHTPKQLGERRDLPYLALDSQQQANILAGLAMGWYNVEWEIEASSLSNLRMIDICPSSFVPVMILPEDTPRHVLLETRLIPRQVSFEINTEQGYVIPTIYGEIETFPENSVDGDIPGDDENDNYHIEYPSMPKFPAFPGFVPISLPPTIETSQQPKVVFGVSSNRGTFWTDKFDQSGTGVVWKMMNYGLTEDEYTHIYDCVVTPSGAIYAQIRYNSIVRAPYPGGEWSTIWSYLDYPVEGSYRNSQVRGIAVDPRVGDRIAVLGGRGWSWPHDGIVGSSRFSFITDGVPGEPAICIPEWVHESSQPLQYASGKWIVPFTTGTGILGSTASAAYAILSLSGSHVSTDLALWWASGYSPAAKSARSKDLVWTYNGPTNGYCQLKDGTETQNTSIQFDTRETVSLSPTGTHAMGSNNSFVPYRTTDGGVTWESAAGTIAIGPDVWENCGNNAIWIFGGGPNVKLTMDQGVASVEEKIGNLLSIAPMLDVTHLRFIA